MSHYSEEEKLAIKSFIMDKISKTLDDALIHLEKSYDYDNFRSEVFLGSFYGRFKLHFVPKNEMNDGQNYRVSFEHHDKETY